MKKPVIIFGAKGIAKSALDIFQQNQIVVYGFVDDDETIHGSEIEHVPVLGATDDHGFLKLIGKKCEAFMANEHSGERKKLVKMLNDERKVMPTNAIHPGAHIASSAAIGHGLFIDGGVHVGAGAQLGQHNIIQAQATIERDVKMEDYVHIGPGAIIGAEVVLRQGVFIGAGAVLAGSIEVGKNARIGAGSVVVESVKPNLTMFGNPAKALD